MAGVLKIKVGGVYVPVALGPVGLTGSPGVPGDQGIQGIQGVPGSDVVVTPSGTSGAVTVDTSTGTVFRIAPTGAITLTITGTASVFKAFTIIFANSTYAITWPAGTKFPGGTTPSLSGQTWISGVRDEAGVITVSAAWSAVA